jgi:hypothetical protein
MPRLGAAGGLLAIAASAPPDGPMLAAAATKRVQGGYRVFGAGTKSLA